MKISSKLLKAWRVKRSRGDVSRLVTYVKASKPTIIKAINHGEASEKIILKISRFYSEKRTVKDIELKALNIVLNAKSGKNNCGAREH